ncbi:MAG: acetylxylan esterase [Opitutales bacterium]|nr:acetylxylan esterase [Opitutales bacterium]
MIKRLLLLVSAVCACASPAYSIDVKNSSKNNIAKIGEKVVFTAENVPENSWYELKLNGKRIEFGDFKGEPVSYTPDKECWISFKVEQRPVKGSDAKPQRGENGVVVAPEKMKAATLPPADLDKFWGKIKKEVEKYPAKNPRLEKAYSLPAKDGKYAVDVYKFEVKADGGEYGSNAGVMADGYLALPVGKAEKMPIVATFFGAGSFSADPRDAQKFAQEGAIGISMNPHAIPMGLKGDERKAFIDEKINVGGKNYRFRGIEESPADVYFVGMFKRLYQTLRMGMARPEWDGKNIAVRGFSQGGAQTIVAGYLCPKVNVMAPLCPAMCDNGAPAVLDRHSGWPNWTRYGGTEIQLENGRYFDPALMATRIKGKMIVGIGLLDNTCAPTAVTAMFNNLKSRVKKPMYMQGVGHGWNKDWTEAETEFILANTGLKSGK